jgi:hypothetical protein
VPNKEELRVPGIIKQALLDISQQEEVSVDIMKPPLHKSVISTKVFNKFSANCASEIGIYSIKRIIAEYSRVTGILEVGTRGLSVDLLSCWKHKSTYALWWEVACFSED